MTLARGAVLLLAVTWLAAPAEADPEHWVREGNEALTRAKRLSPSGRRAKNVILLVGDGMGVSTVTAARILDGQRRGDSGEENLLAFERLPYLALIKTYNTNQQVPDSAGTITALMSGVKTRAGVIGLDESVPRGDAAAAGGHAVRTLLERAEERGLSTGVVTTSSVTHATPAGAYAHCPERGWENDARMSQAARDLGFLDIARQLVEQPSGDGLEVALGGGRENFLPAAATDPEYPDKTGQRRDGRDLASAWAEGPNSAYVWNAADFAAVDPARSDRLLGLFEPGHMQFEHDRAKDGAGEPSLPEMTAKAIDLLSKNRKGFFLMVEGARIDHAHHMNNAYRALTDALAFSDAVRVALEKTDPDETLVIVTADHSHVFTIAGYPTRGNDILGKVVDNDRSGAPLDKLTEDARGRPYTTLGYQNGPGLFAAALSGLGKQRSATDPLPARPDLREVDTAAPDYLQEAAVPLRYETHSGEDVAAYAGGPGAQWVHGVQEQSYLYYVMAEALGLLREPGFFERLFSR